MDITFIKDWANQNQGVLAIVLFLLTLAIGWISGFFKWLLGKFDRKASYVTAGGDIKAGGDISVGNKVFNQKSGKNSTNLQGENVILSKYGNDK